MHVITLIYNDYLRMSLLVKREGNLTRFLLGSRSLVYHWGREGNLRTFIGVETAALTFRTKQYSTSNSSHICYGIRFFNDFFLNHHTIALVNNCLKLLSCVVIDTALDLMKKNQLS